MRSGRVVGAAMTLAGGFLLATGVAGADTTQVPGCSASCGPQSLQVSPPNGGLETSAPVSATPGDMPPAPGETATGQMSTSAPASGAPGSQAEVLPESESRTGAPASAAPADLSTAPGGGLPFTGGDVLGLTLLGAGALGTGVVLVRRSRRAADQPA